MPLQPWHHVHPLLALAVLFICATLLAAWPIYVARRYQHPRETLIRWASAAWLLIGVPVLCYRPEWCLPAAYVWAGITIAAYWR